MALAKKQDTIKAKEKYDNKLTLQQAENLMYGNLDTYTSAQENGNMFCNENDNDWQNEEALQKQLIKNQIKNDALNKLQTIRCKLILLIFQILYI